MAHSPCCIPVTAALGAFGVAFRRVEVPNWDRLVVAEVTGGRYYAVPVLVDGGQVVFESGDASQDVVRYTGREFAGGRLFRPRHDGVQAVLCCYLEEHVESVTFKCIDPDYIDAIPDVAARTMVVRHKERKFGRGCVERWREERPALCAEAERHFAPFNNNLPPPLTARSGPGRCAPARARPGTGRRTAPTGPGPGRRRRPRRNTNTACRYR
jgi:glutathione S-transferase